MQKKKNYFSYLRSKKIKTCNSFGENIRFLPVEIAYFDKMNSRALDKKIKKAKAFLKKENVLEIILTKELQNLLGIGHNEGIHYKSLLKCFELLSEKVGLRMYNTIYFYDNNLSVFNYESAKRVIWDSKKIVVCTSETEKANSIAEKVFFDYGIWIYIKKNDFVAKNSSVYIDVDNGKIRIGDITADGVEYDIDCGEYDIDIGDLTKVEDVFQCLKIKNIISGKNLIKIS